MHSSSKFNKISCSDQLLGSHSTDMIDKIIEIARATYAMNDSALQPLADGRYRKDNGLQDFQKDLARALLASSDCRSAVSTLLQSTDPAEIEQTVRAFCKENTPYIPPVFLVGRAVMYRVEQNRKS